MINGFLSIDKEKGVTSARVVGKVKRLFCSIGEKDTKIGHFGTLDPDGEGVLPLALGRATRLFAYQDGKTKLYRTELQFGISTDTLDTGGSVVARSDVIPSLAEVARAAEAMRGKQLQIPPAYSAKSVGGVRAYRLAREGVYAELPPKEIEIYGFERIAQVSEDVFRMEISVSSGTYIRSVARDMGAALGTVCAMKSIKRLKNGVFELSDAVRLDALNPENLLQHTLPTEYFLRDFPRVDVPDSLAEILLTGSELYGLTLPDGPFTVYLNDKLVGMGEKTAGNRLRVKTWLR